MPQADPITIETISELFNKLITSELPDDTLMISAMLATEYPENYENERLTALSKDID